VNPEMFVRGHSTNSFGQTGTRQQFDMTHGTCVFVFAFENLRLAVVFGLNGKRNLPCQIHVPFHRDSPAAMVG